MKLWWKVRYNRQKDIWFVDGMWRGKRLNFYSIPTRSNYISCKTEQLADHLQLEISKDIAQGIFHPERYRKQKPLHMAKFAHPLLGDEYVGYITHEKLQVFINELRALGLSIKTIKNCYALLYQIIGDAHKSGYVHQMPAPIAFQMPVKTIEWLDRDKQEAILEKIPARHRFIFRFIFGTGCRPSEARALRKKDVKEDRIEFKKTFAPSIGGQVLGIVKNRREQAIPLYDAVRRLLDEMPKHLDEWVFVNPDTGRPYTKNINRDIWNPACEAALGYRIPLKNAGRHSLAHQLLAAGLSFEDVRDALRHSSTGVTRAHYAKPNLRVIGERINKARE